MTRPFIHLFLLLTISTATAIAQTATPPRGASVEVKQAPPDGALPQAKPEPVAPESAYTVVAEDAPVEAEEPRLDARVADLVAAYEANALMPLVSDSQLPVDLAAAYAMQKDFVQITQGGQPIAGFKAGLTSRKAQQRFGAEGPVGGVLPRLGRRDPGQAVELADYNALMIECELAFILAKPIDAPVADVAALRQLISGIAPAIELPDLGYTKMKELKVADLIASNVGARAFIIGEAIPVDRRDLNDVVVTLTHNGTPVNEGEGADAMRDQWRALLWLVNHTVAQGYTLQPGQVLITGALGEMVKAEDGVYVATFGEIGSLHFTVKR